MPAQTTDSFVNNIRRAHDELRLEIRGLRSFLSGPENRAILCQHLTLLQSELTEHFELEEADGYMGDAVQTAPRLHDEAERLLHQHPQMLQLLTQLIRDSSDTSDDKPDWLALVRRTEEFIELLTEHERGENTLVQSAYEDDIGDKD